MEDRTVPVVYVAAPETGWTAKTFLQKIIDPALDLLSIDGSIETLSSARQLLLGTALQESNLIHVKQIGGGPALGYFQMEPSTHDDIWANYLKYQKLISPQVMAIAGYKSGTPPSSILAEHPIYAATMARIHYRRRLGKGVALPGAGDIKAMAACWKKHYNTVKGKGAASEFEEKLTKVINQI